MAGQPATVTVETASPAETERVAGELAATLAPGDVVLLAGDLGSGKTTFVRGACRALGVDAPVTSPSFTVGNVYPGPCEVAHVDLFRLEQLTPADEAELDDYLTGSRIGFVEWPRAAAAAGVHRVRARVELMHAGGDRRRLTIERLPREGGER